MHISTAILELALVLVWCFHEVLQGTKSATDCLFWFCMANFWSIKLLGLACCEIRSMPRPVKKRRCEQVSGRVGRKGAHISLHWQQQGGRAAPSLLEPQPCAPQAWAPAASWSERSPQSCAEATLWTDGTVPTSPAEPTGWRDTMQKEQRMGVVYLLNVLGFVWSLIVVLLLSEALEVTGRSFLFADPKRV